MKYGGLLGRFSEAADIQRELGVDYAEAIAVQVERSALRHCEETQGIFAQHPFEIAQKVAAQMGCTVEEAIENMEAFDQVALLDFHVGNNLDRKVLH